MTFASRDRGRQGSERQIRSTSPLRVFAPAKLNLFLHVTRRRSDGFHDLQSLVAFAGAGDVLAIEDGSTFALRIEGPFSDRLTNEPDNLVLRSARVLAKHFGISGGAEFTLTKNLPVASGIGGGSADAAAAFRGLLALWGLDPGEIAKLEGIAAELGSDIPACLASRAAWMEGRGERINILPALPAVDIVLVNPGVPVATGDIFRRLRLNERQPEMSAPREFRSRNDLISFLEGTRNDLEEPARSLVPAVGDVLDALCRHGALLSRMSGSGATCFGVFASTAKACDAVTAIADMQPGWWTIATRIEDLA